jgi:eukaryotic-like serine/threonine-protein kinase
MAVEDDPGTLSRAGTRNGDGEIALDRTRTADATPHVTIAPGRLPPIDPARYQIVREFAHGGLGRILEVRDLRLGRVVALKEILHDSEAAYARFVREALITARLEHPAIIPVHDVGRWPTGEPFYSMKLVSGRSLGEVITATAELDGRLALLPNVIAVADAVAYAHSQGIIHRDLKPANVLVGEFGETVVIDWGLAKDLRGAADGELGPDPAAGASAGTVSGEPSLTVAGTVLGTPYYMPPEQASGAPVAEGADVYALGALLYEVLTGERPYHGTPEPLAAVLAGPPVPAEERDPAIPPDLAAIARKAMARRPEDRYPSARELAEDLRRFQTGRLVSAHAYSRRTLLTRWLRRYRAPVSVAAVAATILAVVGVVSVKRVIAERDLARRTANELVLIQAEGALERDATEALMWLRTYPEDGEDWAQARRLAIAAESRGVARHVPQRNDYFAFTADSHHWIGAKDGEHLDLHDAATGAIIRQVSHSGRVEGIIASLDGHTLAIHNTNDTAITLLDLGTGHSHQLPVHPSAITTFAVSPDGKWVASGSSDGLVRIAPTGPGDGRELHDQGDVYWVAFSRDSRWLLLMASGSVSARLWDVESGATRAVDGPRDLVVGDVSPDGTLVAFAHEGGAVSLWSTETGKEVRSLGRHANKATWVAFSPDGRWIASIGGDANILVTSVATGTQRTFSAHKGAVTGIAFSPDSKLIATGGDDGEVRLWAVDGDEERVLGRHVGDIFSLSFSPDGSRLVTRISGGPWFDARLWDVTTRHQRGLQCHRDKVSRVAISSDGLRMATASYDNGVCLWDLRTGEGERLEGHDDVVTSVAFSPNGAWLASASFDGKVQLWDLKACSGAPIKGCKPEARVLPGHRGPVWMVAFSPDGAQLASAGADARVRLWNTTTGEVRVLLGHTSVVRVVAFAPDGRRLASAGEDHEIRLWNLETNLATSLRGHGDGINIMRFSKDGSLWTASADTTVRRWDVTTGLKLDVWKIDSSPVFALSPDNRWLAASGDEGRVVLVNLVTRAERELGRHRAAVYRLEFSPDGAWLSSAGRDHTVRLWDVERATLEGMFQNEFEVLSTAFFPDGKSVAVVGGAVVRIWPTPSRGVVPIDPGDLRAWMAGLSTATLAR